MSNKSLQINSIKEQEFDSQETLNDNSDKFRNWFSHMTNISKSKNDSLQIKDNYMLQSNNYEINKNTYTKEDVDIKLSQIKDDYQYIQKLRESRHSIDRIKKYAKDDLQKDVKVIFI